MAEVEVWISEAQKPILVIFLDTKGSILDSDGTTATQTDCSLSLER